MCRIRLQIRPSAAVQDSLRLDARRFRRETVKQSCTHRPATTFCSALNLARQLYPIWLANHGQEAKGPRIEARPQLFLPYVHAIGILQDSALMRSQEELEAKQLAGNDMTSGRSHLGLTIELCGSRPRQHQFTQLSGRLPARMVY